MQNCEQLLLRISWDVAPTVANRYVSWCSLAVAQVAVMQQAAQGQTSGSPPASNSRKRQRSKVPAVLGAELGYLPCLPESQNGSAGDLQGSFGTAIGVLAHGQPAKRRQKVLHTFCSFFKSLLTVFYLAHHSFIIHRVTCKSFWLSACPNLG